VRGSVLLVEKGEEDGERRLGRENESHRGAAVSSFFFFFCKGAVSGHLG